MTDLWMPRLSEYLDGDLSDEQSRALEQHVASCEACSATLGDLKRVVARARGLEDREPATDLWPGIAHRIATEGVDGVVPIETRRRPGWFLVSRWQLAAAAGLLVGLTGGATWLIQASLRGPAPVANLRVSPGTRITAAGTTNRGYDAAIADLERTLQQERGQLDTGTVRVVEHNLWVIDQAIAQARQALTTDPSSVYLNGHLADAMRRKLDLLRRATAIPTVQS
ncbi:MAG TPA: zf-HC2 domain-containing protein [Gemmatimonadales bacterium]|jgi:hypothetical protein